MPGRPLLLAALVATAACGPAPGGAAASGSGRLGAVVVTLVLLFLALRLWRLQDDWSRRMTLVLVAALVTQICLGLSNVYWALPLPVAVAHNAFGLVLLLVLVTLNYGLRKAGEKKHV